MNYTDLTLLNGDLRSLRIPTQSEGSEHPPEGTLVVNSQGFVVSRNGAYDILVDMREPLYPFSSFTFTAPRTGDVGPTLSQARTAYGSTPFTGDTQLFNVVNGVQEWTVPTTGIYRITARGATRSLSASVGSCNRVLASGQFELKRGDKLRMICGQVPTGNYAGAGGTFVESVARGLLVVSGGAGGALSTRAGVTTEQAGSYRTPAGVDQPAPSTVGSAGPNRAVSYNNAYGVGGGGASWNSDAITQTLKGGYGGSYTINVVGSKSFKSDGRGGAGTTSGHPDERLTPQLGGFGGGGGAYSGRDPTTVGGVVYEVRGFGGGGGYTGGSGGPGNNSSNSSGAGGDGGCYVAPFSLLTSLTLAGAVSSARGGQVQVQLIAQT